MDVGDSVIDELIQDDIDRFRDDPMAPDAPRTGRYAELYEERMREQHQQAHPTPSAPQHDRNRRTRGSRQDRDGRAEDHWH
eukprot:10719861-Alexandrium_andersonii.AAC.1